MNDPQSLSIDHADDLVINGRIDLDDLVMVITGAVAGGRRSLHCGFRRQAEPGTEIAAGRFPKKVGRRYDGTVTRADREFD
jgi:hypothetical protein